NLIGSGDTLGLHISYAVQQNPEGISQALLIGEDFINGQPVCLILGDNIFYGDNLTTLLKETSKVKKGATIYAYNVQDPERYGVLTFDVNHQIKAIHEKPQNPASNWVVTGIYFFDQQAVNLAKQLKPSKRGELEITDLLNLYLKKKQLHTKFLGRGFAWLDTGTYESLLDAATFIKTIEDRQGLKISCIEEIAYRMGFISAKQLKKLAKLINTNYGEYLLRVAKQDDVLGPDQY
ncbi:MAG: glucose-1-phosphate thymidylyltransferase, partial [Candidatus Omnitrophica bacterium]|nr:glucose-1-phosphate thymidylyltransferase [Candidatus Omnitrophota bacterium]